MRSPDRSWRLAAGAALMVALLACAACGSQPAYGFTRHVTVDLTGTRSLQGTFQDHHLAPVAEACAWSADPSRLGHGGAAPYPTFGGTDGVQVAGTRFSATFHPPARAPETVQAAITIQIGDTYYDADPGTVQLRKNGSGEIHIAGATQESGTGSLSGTVSWTCRNQS